MWEICNFYCTGTARTFLANEIVIMWSKNETVKAAAVLPATRSIFCAESSGERIFNVSRSYRHE